MTFLSTLMFGALLGAKHSIEPDHLIAVTNMVTETKKVRSAAYLGIIWGLGHTLTLLIIGTLLILLKLQVPPALASVLEGMVGIMLMYFGIHTFRMKHAHIHSHHHTHGKAMKGSYLKTLFMGFVHGVSGSASMVLLTMVTVDSPVESFVFILVFGIGTTISMMFSTSLLGLPFAASKDRKDLNIWMSRLAGVFSFVFGAYYTFESVMPVLMS